MPGVTLPVAPRYSPAPPTSEDIEYADLAIIDISKAATPEGRAELAITVREAMTNVGFFYVINHGYDQAQVDRMTDIADVFFSGVSQGEKKSYEGTMKTTGSYQGYKLRNYWHVDAGVRDQIEHYNFNKDVYKREHPQPIRPFLPEIEAFSRHNHFNVVHPVLRLLALGLELDEEALVNMHGFDARGDSYVRFMKYYPRSEEDE
ncbi:Isopenicillin N synthase-like superfamily protein, partial [Pleurotus pulmonarius]